jgi:hypothetical protein
MKKYIISSVILSILMITSCVKDLDVIPKDPSFIMSGNLKDDPIYMEQVLAKIYASFIIAGQGPGEGKGPDIETGDENFFTTTRALWNLQEITTDEAICGWNDVGIADLNTQTWSITNPFLTALYQRLSLSITYANDFIYQAKDSDVPEKDQYIAEARFLRTLAYYWQMDLFGNPPFTTESDGVGKYFPKQTTRAEIFNYIISELKDIESDLPVPGYSYPQADKGACWMLLARTYLNAEVYTGTPMWDSCKLYCDKVINSGAYSLAADYRHNFTADNGYNDNPEMIFAWEQDGTNTQGYVGTTFIIESCSDAVYIRAEDFHGLTSNTNWNGNRARKEFVDILVDTLVTYGGSPIPSDDTLFTQCPDGRVYLSQKLSVDIPSSTSSGDYGTGVYKFTAKNYDGSQAENHNPAYASTDFPVFRLAEAYLMRAEALHNMEDDVNAAADINVIKERAYGDASGNIIPEQVTDNFILDELGREFYYEAHRRTDLIRFGKYTNGDYNWQWKGGVKDGMNTSPHRNLFPIPGDEISANPNLTQNQGY